MDPETGFDAVANIGVSAGRIVKISTDDLQGSETIDATGHVVAPGFIDTHSHVGSIPFGQKQALRYGVTTPLELELGLLSRRLSRIGSSPTAC